MTTTSGLEGLEADSWEFRDMVRAMTMHLLALDKQRHTKYHKKHQPKWCGWCEHGTGPFAKGW